MLRPGVTIVIPAYNRQDELKRCLDSIYAQTLRPAQIIVVDDGSTDLTADVARGHKAGVTLIEGPHAGAAAARNLGLENVTTEWTMFFDSDDTMNPDHIENAMKGASDSVDVVGWDVNYYYLSGKRRTFAFATRNLSWHNLMHGSFSTQRYMARTDLFRRAGGWNTSLTLWDDIELGERLLQLNPRVTKVGGRAVNIYQTDNSITGVRRSGTVDAARKAFEAFATLYTGPKSKWIDLKKAIEAGAVARENREAGSHFLKSLEPLSRASRVAYRYQRMGGRGTARLFRPFFNNPLSPKHR